MEIIGGLLVYKLNEKYDEEIFFFVKMFEKVFVNLVIFDFYWIIVIY